MTDKNILFPSDLKQAHDREMERVKIVADKFMEQTVKSMFQGYMKKYGFATNELFIRPPKTVKEIIKEGAAQHNCVGGYVDRITNRQTIVLFLRRQSEPNKPFYTIEWRNNRVMQIEGKAHKPATPEVKEFMTLWENRNKKKTKQKTKVAI